MPLLVTSASGANGDGYGALLAFDRDGKPLGVFCNDQRIAIREAWSFIRKRDSCTSTAVGIESWLSMQTVPLSAIRERCKASTRAEGVPDPMAGITSAYAAGVLSRHFCSRLTRPVRIFSRRESCRFRADLLSVRQKTIPRLWDRPSGRGRQRHCLVRSNPQYAAVDAGERPAT